MKVDSACPRNKRALTGEQAGGVVGQREGERRTTERKEKEPSTRSPVWIEVLVLSFALAHGLLYLIMVPPWQHYDEPGHFEYAWLIANRGQLPQPGDYDQAMRREVAASMLEHDRFRVSSFHPSLLITDKPVWIAIPQLKHPPFYYMLVSLPLRIIRHADITFQLYVARSVSLILYLLSIWIAWRLVGDLTALGNPLRWAVPGMMALLPRLHRLDDSGKQRCGGDSHFLSVPVGFGAD